MNVRQSLGVLMTSVPLLIGCGKSSEKAVAHAVKGTTAKVVEKTAAQLEKISIDSNGQKYLSKETLAHFANKYRPIDTLEAYIPDKSIDSIAKREMGIATSLYENPKLLINAEDKPVIVYTVRDENGKNSRRASIQLTNEGRMEKATLYDATSSITQDSTYNNIVVSNREGRAYRIGIGENYFDTTGKFVETH